MDEATRKTFATLREWTVAQGIRQSAFEHFTKEVLAEVLSRMDGETAGYILSRACTPVDNIRFEGARPDDRIPSMGDEWVKLLEMLAVETLAMAKRARVARGDTP